MPGYVLANFMLYVFVNAFTPGPGNILALNTMTNYGWEKGRKLFFGIFTGYYVVQIMCALFVHGVSTFLPDALKIIKYVGTVYIFWLAIHIAISKPPDQSDEKETFFMKGFLLQFVNVKIWMFGITALTGYIIDYRTSLSSLLFYELVIGTVGTIATLTWIGVGALIQKFYIRYFRIINIILALTLMECIYSILK
ncbi:MAG: LysE family transporter [Clostridiales bacterium]|nr:LysE family transporter [Clostridiales bacterium]